jgi:hypothetical protein
VKLRDDDRKILIAYAAVFPLAIASDWRDVDPVISVPLLFTLGFCITMVQK